jgi:hypothetical protein
MIAVVVEQLAPLSGRTYGTPDGRGGLRRIRLLLESDLPLSVGDRVGVEPLDREMTRARVLGLLSSSKEEEEQPASPPPKPLEADAETAGLLRRAAARVGST